MLPDSSESTDFPTNVMISAFSPRPAMPSSITPAISWPKRTQRVQWMQRVISSAEISGPMLLWNTTRFASRVTRARGPAITDREVLQLAFAALVADRAIERVVDQQELHHRFLRLLGLLDCVRTIMPAVTGVAQAGSGFGAFSTSTRHMRQLAAIDNLR